MWWCRSITFSVRVRAFCVERYAGLSPAYLLLYLVTFRVKYVQKCKVKYSKGYANDKLRGMCKKTVVFVYIEAPAEEVRVLDQDKLLVPRRKILEVRGFRISIRSANHSTETLGDNPNRRLVPWLELFVDSDLQSNRTYRNVSLIYERKFDPGILTRELPVMHIASAWCSINKLALRERIVKRVLLSSGWRGKSEL